MTNTESQTSIPRSTQASTYPDAPILHTAIDAETARQAAIREAERAVVDAARRWSGDRCQLHRAWLAQAVENLEAMERGHEITTGNVATSNRPSAYPTRSPCSGVASDQSDTAPKVPMAGV